MKRIILLSILSLFCAASYAQNARPGTPSDQPVQAPPVKNRTVTAGSSTAPVTPSAAPVDAMKAKTRARQASATSTINITVPSQAPAPTSIKTSAVSDKPKKD